MRDERDSTREHSPLRAAEDAVTLDTSGLSVEEVVRGSPRSLREAASGRQPAPPASPETG